MTEAVPGQAAAVPAPRTAGHRWAHHLDPASVLRDAPDAMLVVDDGGTIQYANRQSESLFGRASADLVGAAVDDLLPEHARARHREHRAAYSRHPSLRPMGEGLDLMAARADGSVVPVEISLSPLVSEHGKLTLAAVRDVSRQRAAELALRRSEERFRLTFQSSPVGLAVVAEQGRLSLVNAALCRLSGLDEATLQRRRLTDLLPGWTPGAGDDERVEHRLVRADGEPRWVEVTASHLHDLDSGPGHLVVHFYDITERRSHHEQLQVLALSDPLTGLPNRALLLDRLEQALAGLRRRRARVALLLLDLDRFKDVNDTLGHPVGDHLLREVAHRLELAARTSDTVARLGGDEFAVLCSDLSIGELSFARRLLEALAPEFEVPVEEGHRRLTVGASIGIAIAEEPGVTATDLYRDADLALYESKARGRGRATVFDQSLRERLHEELTGEQHLRRALARPRGVLVALQPLVDLASRRVLAQEALVRIAVPGSSTLLLPERFLPAAGERGLYPALDLAVLEVCLDRLRRFDDSLHVNVSGASLDEGTWQRHLLDVLTREPQLAGRLCVELTEQTLMTSRHMALESIEQLRLRGVRVGLDDFGTGYSSLSYLERLPLDFLKLDTTLVGRITVAHAARTLAEGIVTLGTKLGLDVVAEGVELAEQAALLQSWGCRAGQGYLFGRPVCQSGSTDSQEGSAGDPA